MAEIGLIASIVQVADFGLRLSLKLYTFGEAVSNADRSIITVSKDISLTSTILKELGHILGKDQDGEENICSENVVRTAQQTVKECLGAFAELDRIIVKKVPNLSQGTKATRATIALEKLKWPSVQPRLQLLKSNLDMLRANISLMLNVLVYAKQVSKRRKNRWPNSGAYAGVAQSLVHDEAAQRQLIQDLAEAKEEYVRDFEKLKLSIDGGPSTQCEDSKGSDASPGIAERSHGIQPHLNLSFVGTATDTSGPPVLPTSQDSVDMKRITPENPTNMPSDEANYQFLLKQCAILRDRLIRELYAPEHPISSASRDRYRAVINAIHAREVQQIETKRMQDTLKSKPQDVMNYGYSYNYCSMAQPIVANGLGPYAQFPAKPQMQQPQMQQPQMQQPQMQQPQTDQLQTDQPQMDQAQPCSISPDAYSMAEPAAASAPSQSGQPRPLAQTQQYLLFPQATGTRMSNEEEPDEVQETPTPGKRKNRDEDKLSVNPSDLERHRQPKVPRVGNSEKSVVDELLELWTVLPPDEDSP